MVGVMGDLFVSRVLEKGSAAVNHKEKHLDSPKHARMRDYSSHVSAAAGIAAQLSQGLGARPKHVCTTIEQYGQSAAAETSEANSTKERRQGKHYLHTREQLQGVGRTNPQALKPSNTELASQSGGWLYLESNR